MSEQTEFFLDGDPDAAMTPAEKKEPTGTQFVEDEDKVEAQAETETEAPVEEAPVEETYTPNLTFKVKDKELEFDDWVKPLVTDKEKEEKLRDLYTKAHGLDELKTTRDTLKTQYEEIRAAKEQQDKALQVVESFVKNKDYRSFFDSLGIPKEDILRYAVEELKFRELPPEQQAQVRAQWDQQKRLALLETQNQELQARQQEALIQQSEMTLNAELSRPDVAAVAQAYDARVGRPGAFRQEVINRGAYHEAISQKTITAQEAVQEVMTLLGGSVQAQPANIPQSQASQPVAPQQKPVLPNIQGASGTSPAKRVPRSIEDLRKIRDQMLQG